MTNKASEPLKIGRDELCRNISFIGDNNKVIGKLTWDGGRFSFEGDADESARIFFDAVCSFVGVMKKDG